MRNTRLYKMLTIALNRSFFLVFPMVFLFAFSMPADAQVVASFAGSQDFLKTDNGQFRTLFLLETDRETYNRIVSSARSMPETLTFTSRKLKKNKYQFSILFTHPAEISYVKKILLFLGVEQLKIDNRLYLLQEYNPEV